MKTQIDIEEIVGPVEWVSESKGHIECPGSELHTTNSKPTDCAVLMPREGFNVPNIRCYHESCYSHVHKLESELRDFMRVNGWEPPPMTELEKESYIQSQELKRVAEGIAIRKSEIFEVYIWPVAEIIKDNPTPIEHEWHQYLDLFDDTDVIWVGGKYDSGERHSLNFRQVSCWKQYDAPLKHFTCTGVFKTGCYNRFADHVIRRRLVTVECDALHEDPTINKDLSGAIIKYLMGEGWDLKCIIDSGNKSIHAHFGALNPDQMTWAKEVLPAIGVDRGPLLNSNQPVRAPGIVRENGNTQRILWLK